RTVQHPVRELVADRDVVERKPEEARRLFEPGLELAARFAVPVCGHRGVEGGLVLGSEPAECAHGEQLFDQPVVARAHRSSSSTIERILRMPRSARDLTVPSGAPVLSATCDCDRPSKYMSSNTSRWSSGSERRALRMASRSTGAAAASTTAS